MSTPKAKPMKARRRKTSGSSARAATSKILVTKEGGTGPDFEPSTPGGGRKILAPAGTKGGDEEAKLG